VWMRNECRKEGRKEGITGTLSPPEGLALQAASTR
jgi:hypothetical protein